MPVAVAARLRRNVPSPETPDTTTSKFVPALADTEEIVPVAPAAVSVKSAVSTPLTLSENVTRQVTLEATVAALSGLSRVMELTTGAVVSIVTTNGFEAGLLTPPFDAVTEKV